MFLECQQADVLRAFRLGLVAVSLILGSSRWSAFGNDQLEPTTPVGKPFPATLGEAEDLEKRIIQAAQQARRATVAVLGPVRKGGKRAATQWHFEPHASGVIVESDGLILSQWHVSHQAGLAVWSNPGDFTEVVLHDGRRLQARLLGADPAYDFSLLKIVPDGDYPHVPLAPNESLALGDWVLKLGHPYGYRPSRGAATRLGRVVYLGESIDVVADCLTFSGDSGGPLINLDGQLVGIIDGSTAPWRCDVAPPTWRGVLPFSYHGVKTIRTLIPKLSRITHVEGKASPVKMAELPQTKKRLAQQLRELIKEAAATKPLTTLPSEEWRQGFGRCPLAHKLYTPVRKSVVEVLVDGARVSLGTVVDANGWVLTKASEISGKTKCRFSDGKLMAAEVVWENAPYDLAMLKVDATELAPVRWAQSAALPVGALLYAPGLAKENAGIGIVSVAERSLEGPFPSAIERAPRRTDYKPRSPEIAGYAGTQGNFRVTHVGGDATDADIRVDDVILSVDDVPIEANQFIISIRGRKPGVPLTLRVQRNGLQLDRMIDLKESLYTNCQESVGPYFNFRYDDFPIVFEHDIPLTLDECGGPVVNLNGEAVGITIARVGEHGCMAIPAHAIRDVIAIASRDESDEQ